MELVCPKCQGTMRSYERNGVHVDQCADCRGIFLDRGELERLVDAETAWHGPAGAAAPAAPRASAQQPPRQASSIGAVVSEVLQQTRGTSRGSSQDQQYGHGQQYGDGRKRHKKESFLSDLFG
jgi:Zn-finger nucleic acid-binding protein